MLKFSEDAENPSAEFIYVPAAVKKEGAFVRSMTAYLKSIKEEMKKDGDWGSLLTELRAVTDDYLEFMAF
jgi:hypothetical protein